VSPEALVKARRDVATLGSPQTSFTACAAANCYTGAKRARWNMKRYGIFAVLGPFLGGFLLLIATTVMSGYWSEPRFSLFAKLFEVFGKSLQYSYLFGILPILMIAAVDDILFHVKRIGPVARMLMVGLTAFMAAELLYGSRGSDSGATQFILYGLVGFVPATISSWLAHEAIDKPATA
jgi:hypothetical protein